MPLTWLSPIRELVADAAALSLSPGWILGEVYADRARLLRAVEVLEEVVERLTDCLNDECRFDHHGYCQAHFLEKDCSVAFARRALADVREG